ncbi:MAG: CoA-binding protein [Thermodesulfobacteriota bacterium]
MEIKNPADDEIKKILSMYRVVAVVGLSDRPVRASFGVASFLKGEGYRIVPVNPNIESVLGEKCYPSLSAIPFAIDIVDVFRRSEAVPPIAYEAVSIGARVLWLQLGVTADESVMRHKDQIKIISDRCIKMEYSRLLG